MKFCPQLNPLDPFHPLKVQAGNFVQPAVERTIAWLNRNRRLAKDVEATIESSVTWLYIASVKLMSRRLAAV